MKQLFLTALCLLFSFHSFSKTEKNFDKTEIRKLMINAAYWQLENPRHDLKDWTNGAFYAGISAAFKATNDEKLKQAMLDMGEKNQWMLGKELKFADDQAIAQTYVDLYRLTKNKKMIEPFIKNMDQYKVTPYQTTERKPITWWWCDALFMAPPAFVKLGVTLNDASYLTLTDSLYRETYNLLYSREDHLFYRDNGYFSKREKNGQKVFWSRGNGWVMGGLALILSELPKNYKPRPFYEKLFKEMSQKIASLQQKDGLWRASLLDPDSYPGGEASGSGFYTYALAWGINNGLLNKKEYEPVVKKAWLGMCTLVQPDGRVGWVQQIGADPQLNFSPTVTEVYGTGAFLLAGSEVIKLNLK
jgi:unsaturated rhamnogalacturonyl hydrolase